MSENNKEYKNVVITGVWETRNGHFNTMPLDAKAMEALTRAAEMGGKFLIRKRSQESMAKAKNPDKAAPFYLEFVPASEVQAYQASRPKRDGGFPI